MRLLPPLAVLVACGGSWSATALRVQWREGESLPLPRGGHASGLVGGRLVIAGGSFWPDAKTKQRVATVTAFDPATNTWTALPDLPRITASCMGATTEAGCYVIGGCDGGAGLTSVFRFADGRWQTAPELPRPLALAAVATVGQRIVLVGGCDRDDTLAGLTDQCFVLDTAQPGAAWRELPPLPGPARAVAAAGTVGDQVYVFGGAHVQNGGPVSNLQDAWRLDLGTEKWTKLRDLPAPVRAAMAVGVGDQVLVGGGYTGFTESGFTTDLWDYDPAADDYIWAGELPHAFGVSQLLLSGDTILVAGGEDKPKSRTGSCLVGTTGQVTVGRSPLLPESIEDPFYRVEDGDWSVLAGGLMQSNTQDHPSRLFLASPIVGDVDFAVRLRLTQPGESVRAADLFFGAQSASEFYYLHLDSQNNMAAFARSHGPEFWTEPVRFRQAGVTFGEWHEARVATRGKRALVWLDGRRVGETTLAELGPGLVGLGTCSAGAEFRDLRVCGVPADLSEPFGPGFSRVVRVVRGRAPDGGWQPALERVADGALRLSYTDAAGARTTLGSNVDGGWTPVDVEASAAAWRPLPGAPWEEARAGCATADLPNGDRLITFASRHGDLLVARHRASLGRWQGPSVMGRGGRGPAAICPLDLDYALVAYPDPSPSSLCVSAVNLADLETPLGAVRPGNPRNTEGSIVELGDGSLLLGYTRFYRGGADEALADISGRLSTDGGATWSEAFLLQPNDADQNVMSVSLLRLADGDLLFGYLRKNNDRDCRLVVRRSSDDGKTWGSEVYATDPPSYYVVNNDRIVQLRSGRLLAPASDHGDISRRPRSPAVCFLSDDGGRTWRRGRGQVELGGIGCQEPGVVELRDGRVLMIIRNSLGTIRQAISSDGGETWGEPTSTGLTSPVAPCTIKRIPSTGDLLMVWNNHPKVRVPLTTAISRDDGQTWEHVRDLEPTGNSFAYTSVLFVGETAVMSYWTSVPGGLALKVRRVPVGWFYEG